ncbi:lipopolysaccharide assembly protein LapA domain-containing protein [Allorhodopirellula solitaria]|uniref:Lipopolysaccharide assembly protein A domain-containing protein n=1 Tax=Allorhodopirellula solitaria TaxID=2527987 RepID=A0A5C5XYM8_9BACT|nr:lipopolysaccharide assembly protein LapA domain-containing protein [Allorhodopirellula solitaria]TWT67045.1 hypothetical protein CA85_18910 [Allorhodopirellula solitaria]
MMQKIRYFLFLVAVLAVIVVAFQNQDQVDVKILFFNGRYPLTLLLLGTSGVSFILGAICTMWRRHRRVKGKTRVKTQAKKTAPKDLPPRKTPGTDALFILHIFF